MKHIKDLKISDEELESKRVTEILEAMALRSGPEYAEKLKKLSTMFLVLLQAADVAEFCDAKPVSLLLDMLGVAMCTGLPKVAGVSEADFITVMRATEEDGEDLQKLLRKKLGI
jgi:hypothetical protein